MQCRCLTAAFIVTCVFAAQASANSKEAVVQELMFCMNFFNGMTTVVAGASKAKMEAVRDSFMQLAVDTTVSDSAMLEKALKSTADRAAGEVVGKNAEQRLATSQKCAPLLEPGAVEKEIARRGSKK
jgi:hypothetical protein